ncbi:hypothetical protein [uncultured Helicobacter sp.]|uniref:hypothetical protein n=1 Tax=uncultured Helicobacter sp. TaxID=175537 RepID=UPI002630561F|nr:hypothetical protein [uncultured Helicobacter sp.]
MEPKSRADYFKERRKEKKAFYVEISKEKAEDLEKVLKEKNLSKREWLESKIDEEVGKQG